MTKVSWMEHKTNEEVLQMVDTEREMMGHYQSTDEMVKSYAQHDSLLRITLEGRIKGKRL